MPVKFERSSGILLHPTSLPGSFGIGDFGPAAFRWIDILSDTRCSYWQVLPLGPTGYGDSPYQCFSAFAGNPLLISPDILLSDGLLFPSDFSDQPKFSCEQVEYGDVIPWKLLILERAFHNFQAIANKHLKSEYEAYCINSTHWLENYAFFMALKGANNGEPWTSWAPDLRLRKSTALLVAQQNLVEIIELHKFQQFLFFRQWNAIREYAHSKGIKIIGDIPIFVAHDSAEVWANPSFFYLDKQGNPLIVAGVPPDYFSSTGQLWGNPLYRWDVHARMGYSWWIERLQATLKLVDVIRLDHFRGFESFWAVPASESTAVNGSWMPGPGISLFNKVFKVLGVIPIIAEDLGIITPQVTKLREYFQLPGMKVLMFAFNSGASNTYLPHNYNQECVVYTGTHDNDTACGWYKQAGDQERDFTNRYLKTNGMDIAWDLIHAAWASIAVLAIAPLQDLLSLGNEARMNFPSSLGNNWKWRVKAEQLNEKIKTRLTDINAIYGRIR